MKDLHIRTPLIESLSLSERCKKRVYLKMENMQPTGAFKIRGIGLLCQEGKRDGARCFVSSSGGNAGIAAAYAGSKLHVPTTIFVPTTTRADFRQQMESYGAEVSIVGDVWDETHEKALGFARKVGGLYISPFDHPLIWKGHASVIDEIALEIDKPDAIVLSVGGGGLLCGVVEGLWRNDWQDVPVLAVETEGTASLATSLKQGRLVTLDKITGIAKTLGAKTVAQGALERAMGHPVQSVVVTDREAIEACIEFANGHKCLVEPACGASLSVAYNNRDVLVKIESQTEALATVVMIVCGGIGVDLERMREWQGIVY